MLRVTKQGKDRIAKRSVSYVWFIVLLCALVLASSDSFASQYSPPGVYDVEHYVLDNGLRVILKPRSGSPNIAIRLAVNVGFSDFPCGKQEIPHFLEHLLFSGTTKHSESEIKDLINDNGGSRNATTAHEETSYEIDIYSKYAGLALDTLSEMMTDSTLTVAQVEDSRAILLREGGGQPSAVRHWLHRNEYIMDAATKAVRLLAPGNNLFCADIESAETITREEIFDVYRRYYVADNMVLIVVGDFEISSIREKIQQSFGALSRASLSRPTRHIPGLQHKGGDVTSQFSPILATDASVQMGYRSVGTSSEDYITLHVLEEYLTNRLFDEVRTRHGLSYSPEAYQVSLNDYGFFGVSADVNIDDMDKTVDVFKEEINKLIQAPLTQEQVNKTKRSILLQWVQGYEANTDLADYYLGVHRELEDHGELINWEARVEAVSPEMIHMVAMNYFKPDKAVIIRESPTMTFTQFIVAISIITILFLCGILYMVFKHRIYRRG